MIYKKKLRHTRKLIKSSRNANCNANKDTTSDINSNVDIKTSKHLSILSYNISWESMSGKNSKWPLCSNNTNPNSPKHNSICVSNIAQVINNNPTDFITLQEASNYKKLMTECLILKHMKHKEYTSGLDTIITFWKPKYKMHTFIEGEFEKGRPWLGVIFTNGICLINVHFGHYSSNEEFEKLENMIKIIKMINISNKALRITRYIISGDFNYDIKTLTFKQYANAKNRGLKKKGNYIIVNNLKFFYNRKHILTCRIARRQHNDHILDTYKPPVNIIIPKVEYMASDHKPIISLLHS
jgi:endonuclease/exonuclease/phosphatase family metal-dependent hydrolase